MLACLGIEAVLSEPPEQLGVGSALPILVYVLFADVLAVSACSRPSVMRTTVAMVTLLPKLFFVLLDASTFFAVSVWVTVALILLLAAARRGVQWEIVELSSPRHAPRR